jgi:hypothetical protein
MVLVMASLIHGSSEVIKTIDLYQSVIGRMANSSASAKNWCVTIVSAVILLAAEQSQKQLVLIALIPTMLFFILDIYYLTLERKFRESHDDFVDRLCLGTATKDDLFKVGDTKFSFAETCSTFSCCRRSFHHRSFTYC